MSFSFRLIGTWSSKTKTVSFALIVSTWVLLFPSVIFFPVIVVANNNVNDYNNAYSNITLLDLYPELKEHLLKKALSQISLSSSSTENYNSNFNLAQQVSNVQQNLQNTWGYDSLNNYNQNAVNPLLSTNPGVIGANALYTNQEGYGNSRRDYPEPDSDPADTYNYQKEVLKYFQPFGPPELYDSWKFKPSPTPAVPSYAWSSYPSAWEEEHEVTEEVSHELSKDFSCLAGLLGLKTLKKLKIAAIFKKLKYIAIFFIAFKLGVLLSPIAIPLLFPIILLVTAVKILPLILIIVLLLKILKKQVKIKKPFGKFLDQTSSLFFDDVDSVTEKVLNSEECVNNISCSIGRKSGKGSRLNSRRSKS